MGPPHLTPGLVRPLSPADPTLGAFSHVQPCTSGLLLGRAKDLAAASFLCLSRVSQCLAVPSASSARSLQSVPAPGQKMRGTEVTLDSVESLHFWYGALRISCQKPAGSVSAAAASLPPLFLPCRLSALSGVNSPRPYRKCPGHEPRSECHLFSPRHGVQLLPKDPRGGSIKVPVIVRKCKGTWPGCWQRDPPAPTLTAASRTASSSWGTAWPRTRRRRASSCRGCAGSAGVCIPGPWQQLQPPALVPSVPACLQPGGAGLEGPDPLCTPGKSPLDPRFQAVLCPGAQRCREQPAPATTCSPKKAFSLPA
ncbi:uncharacterized protein LOC121359596 isoform X3 [Pyrgilauda ruficollis]|uniref:uncharacterized protein LOC121359596 isoform X3 n=1 Tax=Pyrgilauda ruficollis TaxID=221976 RepID=UPI001B88174E|nr:uncharacterized protein LOC121359596 isoform X3 [Pyrgilauda ruficollis]